MTASDRALVVASEAVERPRPDYGRRRAFVLASVYVLFAVHIVHWRLAGRTLAPLELNEVLYTLELGVVTAGAIFMAAVVLATAVFGRFFCSWGCHILALEDLASWLLGRIGIKPRPIRSRVLLLVPPLAMLYMFAWPHLTRGIVAVVPDAAGWLGRPPAFDLRVLGDGEGWASFVTEDYWRNLPGPGITIATFLVCGFAVVYVLGSRSFCTYGCPYGALFGAVDRIAPGRILLRGECTRCAKCTAACQSHVRVHEEIDRFGKVVDPGCLKDLDCVAVCPTGGLAFGFGRPAGLLALRSRRPRVRYDLSVREEILVAAVVVASIAILRGLYFRVPFLLTLGAGALFGFGAVLVVRLLRWPDVRALRRQLKRGGALTGSGRVAIAVAGLALLFLVHSGVIRWHQVRGQAAFDALRAELASGERVVLEPRQVDAAAAHLGVCHRFGLHRPIELERMLASLLPHGRTPHRAEPHLRAVLEAEPDDAAARQSLAHLLAEMGRFAESADHLRALIVRHTGAAEPRYALGVVLSALGRDGEAIAAYREALRLAPDAPHVLNNLAFLLDRTGEPLPAIDHLRRALALAPDYAEPHFNLGRILWRLHREEEARTHFHRAAALEPGLRAHVPAEVWR